MGKRFVILGMHRSGSGYLYTMLNNHPDLIVHGELFKPKNIGALSGKLKKAKGLRLQWLNKSFRDGQPMEFLERVMTYDPDAAYTGFKIFFSQEKEVLKHVIASGDYKKIVLLRENMLAAYSSAMTARTTGQGKVKKGETPKRVKIIFDANDFRRFENRRNKRISNGYRLLEKHGSPFLEVKYTELLSGQGFEKIFNFLEIPVMSLESEVVKRNPSRIIDRFDNPDQVIAYMEKIGREDWIGEEKF